MKESFQAAARSGFAATGGSSTMAMIGGSAEAVNAASFAQTASSSSAGSSPPAWAQRLKRGASTAAHAVKSGDSRGGGHSVDLSGKES